MPNRDGGSNVTIETKYDKLFANLDRTIDARKTAGIYPAMGYTSNLDILCDFRVDVLNGLLEKHLPDADLQRLEPAKMIRTVEDFISTVVWYCRNGAGGEADIEDFAVIDGLFDTKPGMGGTSAQAAMALAAVGCPSVIHLTDDSKEVCDILRSPLIYTVSPDGELIHTDRVSRQQEQEIHYIIQFKKGDVIRCRDQAVEIPASNRLIVTKVTVNAFVPFSQPYFDFIEQNAKTFSSNVLSSFNCIQDEQVLRERLDAVKRHVRVYKENNPDGVVFFEDAHYHSLDIRKLCIETLYPEVDIVCMNEEELALTLGMYNQPVDIRDILSCIEGVFHLKRLFNVKKGIIVHTKDYAMYAGDDPGVDIESGLVYGNLIATAKAMYGTYGTKAQIAEVMKLPLSETGMRHRETVAQSPHAANTVIVPTKYIDKPKYTIGLGDSFVGGVQICFM
jgi:ADP-dependent phosphofructokinase/glucokinase